MAGRVAGGDGDLSGRAGDLVRGLEQLGDRHPSNTRNDDDDAREDDHEVDRDHHIDHVDRTRSVSGHAG
jgi:hypothetical protein